MLSYVAADMAKEKLLKPQQLLHSRGIPFETSENVRHVSSCMMA